MAQLPTFDLEDLKRRMQAAHASLKHELGGLRTGRASASLLEPVQVEAYGQRMPLNQVATISVPEPRALAVSVWDKSMVHAVDKAIRDSNLGLSPTVEGTTLRIRIPELNEQRRKEMVKIAHKYAEDARVAVRHVRRDGIDILKKLLKDHAISEDDEAKHADRGAEGDRPRHQGDRRLARRQGKGDHAGLGEAMVREDPPHVSRPLPRRSAHRPDAHPRGHHHGRQRPLGESARACLGSKAIAAASRRSAARSGRRSTTTSATSPSIASPRRTGGDRPTRWRC